MYAALKSCFKLNLHGGKHIIRSETKPQARGVETETENERWGVGWGKGSSTSNEVVSDIRLLRLKRPLQRPLQARPTFATLCRLLSLTSLSLFLSLPPFFVYFCAMPRFAHFLPAPLFFCSPFTTSCTCRSIVRHFLCKLRCFHLLHLYAALFCCCPLVILYYSIIYFLLL